MSHNIKWDVFNDITKIPIALSDFMYKSKHGSLYQYPIWVDNLEIAPSDYMAFFASKNGTPVIGALVEKSRIPGTKYFSGYVHRGPVFENLDCTIDSWKDLEILLIKNGCIALSIYPYWEREASKELTEYLQSDGYDADIGITEHSETLAFDITKPEEELFASLKASKRNGIRKAKKKGILLKKIETEKDMQIFWEMYDKMCNEKSLESYPLSFFQKIRSFAIQYPKYCCCAGAWLEQELIGATISLRHGERATLWKGGASPKKIKGVSKTDLVIWYLILWAKNSGARIFDLGGITPGAVKGTQEWGINEFKKGYSKNEIFLFKPHRKIFKPHFYYLYLRLKKIKNGMTKSK